MKILDYCAKGTTGLSNICALFKEETQNGVLFLYNNLQNLSSRPYSTEVLKLCSRVSKETI